MRKPEIVLSKTFKGFVLTAAVSYGTYGSSLILRHVYLQKYAYFTNLLIKTIFSLNFKTRKILLKRKISAYITIFIYLVIITNTCKEVKNMH